MEKIPNFKNSAGFPPNRGATVTCQHPLGGLLPWDSPIPALPPYTVKTPHIQGGTAYAAPNSSSGLMMVMLMKMAVMMMVLMLMMMHPSVSYALRVTQVEWL